VVRRDRLDAFRAGAVVRFRDAAAFLPAATRLGDFLAVVRFRFGDVLAVVRLRPVVAFLAAAVFRFLVAAAFFPAVFRTAAFRFLVAAAFLAAVFLVVAFRAVPVRVRVVAAFLPAATRLGDFLAVVRLRVVAAFFAVVLRDLVVAAFFAAVFRFRVVAAFFAAVFRVVEVRLGTSIGPVDGLSAVSDRGVERSRAGVSGCHDGGGAAGESIVLCSFASSDRGIRSSADDSSPSVLG
jgi:hypothetical protein